MKELFKQFLDNSISRSQLLTGLSAVGLSAAASSAIAESLVPTSVSAAQAGAVRTVHDTGGMLYVQQLKAAGVKYCFCNPSTGDAPIYNAFAAEPSIQLIKGIQEGVVLAMADGYARLSGKTGVMSVANVGLPNALTQMVNSYKDRIPLLMVIAAFGTEQSGKDGPQDYEHQELMTQPLTKWWWLTESTSQIPETTRRALKFASTPPGGPVFVSIPDNLLAATGSADIIDQSLYDVPMKIRADAGDIEKVAQMLLDAKSPLLSVGDEITMSNGENEVLELAELLGLPTCGGGEFGVWSKPFPTQHALYLGPILRNTQFPGNIDVRLNIGNQYGEVAMPGQTLISIRSDPTSLARVGPVDMPLVSDTKLAVADLVAALKSIATADRLRQIAADRSARVAAYTNAQKQLRQNILTAFPGNTNGPIALEQLAYELERGLDHDTIYVTDSDSGKRMDPFMTFGPGGKTYVGTGPNILGWGLSAAAGAKLARPDSPVVGILGDGACLFGGPQPLWTQARYNIPVTNIVLNNRSYNNERNRIWTFGTGYQFQKGLDMMCYNGSPDVDFVKASEAFGVEAELVKDPSQIRAALARSKRANAEGRPYFLEMSIQRDGVGAGSTWYPPFSVAALRTRNV